MAVRLERDVFPEGEVRGRVLRSLAISLAILRAVDAAEADAFSMVAVQYFDGVAVEGRKDGASEVSERGIGEKKEDETCQ